MNIKINPNLALLIVSIFVLVFQIAYYTPMHSDDFTYLDKGLDLKLHYQHYLNWSGRIVADFISPFVLLTKHSISKASLTALAVSSMILLLIKIPNINQKLTSKDAFIAFILFSLYWIANSNLGQTTFWVVGSANYLWTNILILLFIYLFLSHKKKETTKLSIQVCVLALVAGCTNENTGFIPILFIMFFSYLKQRISKDLIIYWLLSCIGYLVLIISPGNSARKEYFTQWYEMSLWERIYEHVAFRIPNMLSNFWLVYFILALIFIIGLDHQKAKKNSASDNENSAISINIRLGLFFILTSFLSVFIMFASPTYPPRAGNGTLIFLLLAVSYFSTACGLNLKENKKIGLTIILTLSVYFIISYTLILTAYKQTAIQEKVRLSSIRNQIDMGLSELTIPDFYFTKLMKPNDKFDLYHNSTAHGKHFGVKNIVKTPAHFNYAILLTTKPFSIENVHSKNGLSIKNIYISDNLLVVETNQSVLNHEDTRGNKIYMHVFYKDKPQFTNYDFYPKETIINGKFYYSREIESTNIAQINFGLFKDNTKSINGTLNCNNPETNCL